MASEAARQDSLKSSLDKLVTSRNRFVFLVKLDGRLNLTIRLYNIVWYVCNFRLAPGKRLAYPEIRLGDVVTKTVPSRSSHQKVRVMQPMFDRIKSCVMTFALLCAALLAGPLVLAFDVQKAVELNKQGTKLLDRAELKEAIEVFDQMQTACGENRFCTAVALFYLGRAHLELSRNDDALEFLNQALDLFTAEGKVVEGAKASHAIGRVYAARSDFQRALREYESAYSILSHPDTRDTGELFLLLVNRAHISISLSDYVAANRDLDEAELLFPNDRSEARMAALSYLRGQISAAQQDYEEATEHYDRALRYYRSTRDPKKVQSLLNNLGIIAEHQADYETALSNYHESFRMAREFDDPSEQAVVLNNLGSVNWKRGNYEVAEKLYTQALDIYERLQSRLLYADTLNNLGLVRLSYGDYSEAFKYFGQSYDIAKDIGSPSVEAWTLHDMAWVLKEQGSLQESKQFSLLARDLARRIGDRRMLSTVLLRLGNLYEYYGDFGEALKQYGEAERVQEEINDQLYQSNTLHDIANMLTRQGRPDEAAEKFEQALRIKRKIGAATGEILCKLALFYIEKNQYISERESSDRARDLQEAAQYITSAEAVIGPENKLDRMLLLYVKGKSLLETQPAQSVPQFQVLHKLATQVGSLKYSFLANVGLGLACESSKNWTESESAFERAVEYAERIRKTLDPVAKRTFLHGEEILGVKHAAPYEGLARVRQRKGDAVSSLDAAEQTKARSFADKISQRLPGTTFGVDAKLLDELDGLEKNIRANHRRAEECRARGGDRSLLPKLVESRKRLEQELTRLEQKIKGSYPTFHAVRFAHPIPVDKSALRVDELALAYEVTDTGVIVYLIKDRRVEQTVFKPISRMSLDALVRKLREPFEDVSQDNLSEKLESFDFSGGNMLFELLVKDFLPKIEREKPLIVMPDDALGVVPFEMLVMKEDRGRVEGTPKGGLAVKGAEFLADRNPIVYYQSVTALTLARLQKKRSGSGSRVLVIADPVLAAQSEADDSSGGVAAQRKDEIDKAIAERAKAAENRGPAATQDVRLLSAETFNKLSEDFAELPETKKLAKDIQERFGDLADVYMGKQATLSTFRKEIVPKIGTYGKIVLATHGYFGDKYLPEIYEPILLLSLIPQRADNLLRMSTIMDLDLDAHLVTLIACQSGLGRRIAGEGVMGMGRAFQYAGAKSVLMSLWSVAEATSVEMCRVMLEATQSGATNLQALQAGRRAVREAGWDHPFFWAGFILVGEPE